MLEIQVQPGFILAFIFIAFDVGLLAVVDFILARSLSELYYRQIYKGAPIDIKSADIPGVTNFLVGRQFSLPNVMAIFIKLAFLGCTFYIDYSLTSEHRGVLKTTHGTFEFDPSENEWGGRYYRSVERRRSELSNCRKVNKTGESITFYYLAFDLDNNNGLVDEVPKTPVKSTIGIKDRSVTCLSHENVRNPIPAVQIVGCSRVQTRSCWNTTVAHRGATLEISPSFETWTLGLRKLTYRRTIFNSEKVKSIWPEYGNGTMTCYEGYVHTSRFGITPYTICLVFASIEHRGTLVEVWHYDTGRKQLSRFHPGPIFAGSVKFGPSSYSLITKSALNNFNWEALSSNIIADTAVYKRRKFEFVSKQETVTFTVIPTASLVIGSVMIAVVVLSIIVFNFVLPRETRPQLNSINGLSSIAREEYQPTGCSLVSGPPVSIGKGQIDGEELPVVHVITIEWERTYHPTKT